MRQNIRGEHMEVTPALKEYVTTKLNRLDRYELPTQEGRVTMRVLKKKHIVEVTIPAAGMIFRAEEACEDMYAAIDKVIDKLERQARKYKTRVNRKARHTHAMELVPNLGATDMMVTEAEGEDDHQMEIVRTKQIDLKPMDLEEAVMQMDLLGHNFFVFINMENNKVNVVYKRNNGAYGLIDPAYQ
ncbi:ribosome hibernation-promoting factor, HPF/YfiA family [Brevibacillus dissolubilis]|uniref:ribosome hibernation-promoting factor, HPF/YfiA family n=1 Tax=Brevibacillus dissolubilis TaxID=1844116 RepID=UPI001116E774|nr:ribosome-associated translation inhibitor RaiA [Brevibacillus dissolubilis]